MNSLFSRVRHLVRSSARPIASLLIATAIGASAMAQVPPILPNDGLVGGDDSAGNYRLYLMPNLGGATPGAATELGISSALAARMMNFVIDQANADIIALATPEFGVGPLEIWRIKVQGTAVLSETMLTTLNNTNGWTRGAMHRDASGCILVLSRPGTLSGDFTVHRVAVTRGGALASLVPVANPSNDMLVAIATSPSGEILLGGKRAPYSSAAPGVTMTVSQAGGTPVVTSVIPNFHVLSAETSSIGVPALGLQAQGSAAANYSCGGAQSNFQYNSGMSSTSWNDIQLTPSGTQYVLVGVGFNGVADGQHGGLIRINANGCVAGIPSAPITFSHGLNQVAIAFGSRNYGGGCPPSTNVLPQIAELTAPVIGMPWRISLTNGVPNSTAMLIAGRGDLSYGGTPLPQALSVLGGQPHCFLLNGALFQFPALSTDANGSAVNGRPIPNDPGLIGTKLFSQWLVFEATSGIPAFSSAGLISVVQ